MLEELKVYGNPRTKLSRLVMAGAVTPIIRGLYETDKNAAPYLLAEAIYGPSYISFEYALSRYSLIPERVYGITSATCSRGKNKVYKTSFGTFLFHDIPSAAFPFGIQEVKEGDYTYRIAGPEKAICDMIYTLPTASNRTEFEHLLFDDIRIDEDEILELNPETVESFASKYRCRNVTRFSKLLRRMQR